MNHDLAGAPADILEAEPGDLAGTQPQPGQQQQDRIVAPADRARADHSSTTAPLTVAGSRPRGSDRSAHSGHRRHRPLKRRGDQPRHMQVAQHRAHAATSSCADAPPCRGHSRARKPLTSAAVSRSNPRPLGLLALREEPSRPGLIAVPPSPRSAHARRASNRDTPPAPSPARIDHPRLRRHDCRSLTITASLGIDETNPRSSTQHQIGLCRADDQKNLPDQQERVSPIANRHNHPLGMSPVMPRSA